MTSCGLYTRDGADSDSDNRRRVERRRNYRRLGQVAMRRAPIVLHALKVVSDQEEQVVGIRMKVSTSRTGWLRASQSRGSSLASWWQVAGLFENETVEAVRPTSRGGHLDGEQLRVFAEAEVARGARQRVPQETAMKWRGSRRSRGGLELSC